MNTRFVGLAVTSLLAFSTVGRAQIWTRDSNFAPVLRNDAPVLTDAAFFPAADNRLMLFGSFTHLDHGGFASRNMAFLRADGTTDASFASSLTASESVFAAISLSDGRVLALRSSPSAGIGPSFVRYLSDGRIDSSYTPIACTYLVRLAAAPDGRILVYGSNIVLNGASLPKVVRLTADGTIDPTFTAKLPTDITDIYTVAVQENGKVVVSAALPYVASSTVSRLLRLNADGSGDPTFTARDYASAPYRTLAIASDGKVLAGSVVSSNYITTVPTGIAAVSGSLVRFTATGADDTTFSAQIANLHGVDRVAVRKDGQIIAQVQVGAGTGPYPSTVLYLSATGAVQKDLRSLLGADHTLRLAAVQSDGTLFIVHGLPTTGYSYVFLPTSTSIAVPSTPPPLGSTSLNGTVASSTSSSIMPVQPPVVIPSEPTLAHVAADGASSADRDPGLINRVPGYVGYIRTDASSRVLIQGQFTHVNGLPRPGLVRFQADGTLDASFAPNLGAAKATSILLAASDGSAIVLASALDTTPTNGIYPLIQKVVRIRADGSVDAAFKPSFAQMSQANYHAVASDGRVLASYFTPDNNKEENLRVAWLGTDGQVVTPLPTIFSGLSQMVSIALNTPESGTSTNTVVGLPIDFGLYGNPFQFFVPLVGGQYLAGGSFHQVNGADHSWLVRLNADGSVDPSYVPDLGLFAESVFVRLDSAGRVLASGSAWINGQLQFPSIRLTANGRRDPTYYWLPNLPSNWVLQQDNGLPDLNFPSSATNADGVDTRIYSVVLAPNGVAWTAEPLARFTTTDVAKITVPPADQTVVAGRDALFLFGLGTRHAATYQWLFEDNPIAGATLPYLQLTAVTPQQAGHYRVRVMVDGQTLTSDAAVLTVKGGTARIVNFSARAVVAQNAPLVAGFSISSDGAPRRWLIRAMGPTLAQFGVSSPLPDPELGVFRDTSELAHDQGGALGTLVTQLANQVGAFPPSVPFPFLPTWKTKESALTPTLTPGNYTAHVTTTSGNSGPALLEIYDTIPGGASGSLSNIALRGRTGGGANATTLGFVISGNTPLKLLIRGLGPVLTNYGVGSPMADPQLGIYRSYFSAPIATNSGWSDAVDIADAAKRVGAFDLPKGSRDAAILLRLEPGAYTAQLTSPSGSTGEGLIEVYVVPSP